MTEFTPFPCPVHGTLIDGSCSEGCPDCVAMMRGLDVSQMTPEARAAELRMWFDNVLTVNFDILHYRIERLVGRPVFTHELGINSDGLIAEAAGAPHPDGGQIIDDLAAWCEANGKPMIIVTAGDDA